MQVINLLSASAATGVSDAVEIDPRRTYYGDVPLQVCGTVATAFLGTVQIQGSISTEQEILEGTAVWSTISSKTFYADAVTDLTVAFPWIRAYCTVNTNGILNVKIWA